ncbi:MAG TPA: SGNH/GDSL hydrolase family protein [Flavisolibacter sp.]|jgi:lysophospholipase L1-like esterase|nr:SGNH/GDSL hydrolase family protein [Flavisolibacter sp.]
MQRTYTYLALGDSYTIGEAVLLQESFPYQTVQMLRKQGFKMSAPEIIAKTGWTTAELQGGMVDYSFAPKYDFVSLLIGVNNQYRGQSIVAYKQQFESLLNRSIELAGGKTTHCFVLSIPDYSVTPFAKEKDGPKISKEIDAYNNLSKALCIQYKVPYIEITADFRKAKEKEDYIASDGLHPSAKAYTKWAKKLAGAIGKLAKK